MEQITSTANPRIKELVLLCEKSRHRRDTGLFVVEGVREIKNCLQGGFLPCQAFFCQDIIDEERVAEVFANQSLQLFSVSDNVYNLIAYRGGAEGLVAVFKEKKRSLKDIHINVENPFVVVLEAVEKPGNLGAVLRTADASSVAAVIVCDPLTDLYNPNLIRASIGGVFTLPVVSCTSQEACDWLKEKGFQILTAQLQDSTVYYDIDFDKPTAAVFGTESTGLTDFWRQQSDRKVMIPMMGKLDSLNVATSVAILSYEALRQKLQKTK